MNGSEERTADLYVSAISPYSLRRVLPDEAFYYDYFKDLLHFQYAPSMSLQVWFDRKLTDVDVTFFSNDCIFNTYADLSNVLPHIFKGGTMFEMVLSPADHIEGLPDEVIFDIAIKQIKGLFPAAREAEVRKWKVVRERQGVYRALPGMERHRPFQRSPLRQLLPHRRLHQDPRLLGRHGGGHLERQQVRRAHRPGQAGHAPSPSTWSSNPRRGSPPCSSRRRR